MILKMLELNVEIDLDELRSQGFHPVRKMISKKSSDNRWGYDSGENNEIYIVDENGDRRGRPLEYYNLDTGEHKS